MYNITLICTAHVEIGKCNSRELNKIIEEFNPEIIFEELSLAVYNECYGTQNRITLETSAIKMHLQKYKIAHIPVANSELSQDLVSKFQIMTKYAHYRNLIDSLMSLEENSGFQFLNSEQCDELFEKIRAFEKLILKERGDEIIYRILQWGDETVDTYENDILKNVYQFSTENKYDKALMFIGAAHRKSVINKIQEYEKNERLKLNWTFYNSP